MAVNERYPIAEVLEACALISARSDGYFTTTPGGTFDPSGYVKGWAIERAAALLTAFSSHTNRVQVGFVDAVDLDETGFLKVRLSIDNSRKIPAGTTATVTNEGFFGDKSISLTPCTASPPAVTADTSAPAVARESRRCGDGSAMP